MAETQEEPIRMAETPGGTNLIGGINSQTNMSATKSLLYYIERAKA